MPRKTAAPPAAEATVECPDCQQPVKVRVRLRSRVSVQQPSGVVHRSMRVETSPTVHHCAVRVAGTGPMEMSGGKR